MYFVDDERLFEDRDDINNLVSLSNVFLSYMSIMEEQL